MDLSGEHLTALVVILAASGAVCVLGRRASWSWNRCIRVALGGLLIASEAAWLLWAAAHRELTPAAGLPLQLSDAATLLAAAALLTRWRPLVELTYFWAGAGMLQALITPDVSEPFPSFIFFQYYAAHGLVVVAAAFLVLGLGLAPGVGAVRRAALLTLGYTAVVGLVDLLTGGDYMFLRQRPPTPSLLDLLGPWPWYLASATALGIALFALLNLPFSIRRLMVDEGRAEHQQAL